MVYKILDDLKGIMTGSFILQCIQNVEYENADIDIFFPLKPKSGEYGTHNIDNLKKNEPLKYKYKDLKFKGINANSYLSFINNISFVVYEYENKIGHKFQLIGVILEKYNINKINDFINLTFDFDILCNCFDGKKLYINNINNIINKKTIINLQKTKNLVGVDERLLRIYRLIKYLNRGYDILLNTSFGNFKLIKDNDDLYFYDEETNNCIVYILDTEPKILLNLKPETNNLYLINTNYKEDNIDIKYFKNLPMTLTNIYIGKSKNQILNIILFNYLKNNNNLLPFDCKINMYDTTELPLIFKGFRDKQNNGDYINNNKNLVAESFNEKMKNAKCDVKEFKNYVKELENDLKELENEI
jgi:hypothetical protein